MLSAKQKRWYPLKYHPVQAALWLSKHRFNVVPAGRRSGKTEICGKRKLVLRALMGGKWPDWKGFAAAPVRAQAKRIYWNDLKNLVPKSLYAKPPSESNLIIYLINGSEIHVLGMDKPERIEGTPWDHGVLDEYGNMKKSTWPEHVRPALADRKGTCDFIGAPEGRNHYWDLWNRTKEDTTGTWGGYHWISADILDVEEIEQAKKDLDELVYQQEFEGSFIVFTGAAYYNYNEDIHVGKYRQYYNPAEPLVFCFDFNVAPGTASVIQEIQHWPNGYVSIADRTVTAIMGEAYIKSNSNTVRICKKLIEEWGEHEGYVFCYGDVTGGAKGSAKIAGSDWDLIKGELQPVFGDRLKFRVPSANPRERQRVNAVNSRLLNTFGDPSFVIDGQHAEHVVKDFEGVRVDDAGEIDKKRDLNLTHLSDGIGYYIHKEFPIRKYEESTVPLYWK
jgi:hypothetical protein